MSEAPCRENPIDPNYPRRNVFPFNRPEVEVYDVGGTLQGKSRPKLPKKERIPFNPVVESIRENIRQGRLIIYLTSRPRCDSHMLRSWFAQHGLPTWSLLMLNVLPVNEISEIPKMKTLEKLKRKVTIVEAWGNGVCKDIRPYLLTGVRTIHHLSWKGSTESAFPKLIRELQLHPQYHFARFHPHEHHEAIMVKGESKQYTFAAVQSVIKLNHPGVIAAPSCSMPTCGVVNPPDNENKPKHLIVNGVSLLYGNGRYGRAWPGYLAVGIHTGTLL